jgi:hypothetical protein
MELELAGRSGLRIATALKLTVGPEHCKGVRFSALRADIIGRQSTLLSAKRLPGDEVQMCEVLAAMVLAIEQGGLAPAADTAVRIGIERQIRKLDFRYRLAEKIAGTVERRPVALVVYPIKEARARGRTKAPQVSHQPSPSAKTEAISEGSA